MRLTPLDRRATSEASGVRYLVRRQSLIPVTNIKGRTRYYWRNWIPMPRRLNWLWRRLAGR